jgi:hypothetical protein
MDDKLKSIEQKVGRNFDSPPLHLWHPDLSGDIDIRIDREGRWFHEGVRIERESIVRLFASILRREDDGEYYLLTPGEKWRIRVDLLPLMVTDIERLPGDGAIPTLRATLNTGKSVTVDSQHALYLEERFEDIPAIRLPHGLAALFSRGAWYRLVEMAEPIEGKTCVVSAGEVFPLERNPGKL